MNPHDPAKRPGAHWVAVEFGVDDPWALADNLPRHHPLDIVGRLVAATARDVDSLHRELTRAAQAAIQILEPVGQGDHASLRSPNGLLGSSANRIELLIARRTAAYEQLTRAMSSYRRILHDTEAVQPSEAPDLGMEPELNQGTKAGREAQQTDLAIAGGRQQLTASESSPAPEGEAALRDGQDATSRVTAALQRSRTIPLPGCADAGAPPQSLSGTAVKPSRVR
ncbi:MULTISPECIES: hypothetical protein [unclassified Streptomyces]|uniref:hypothetical protein n=1 Tax=unclassified Streptomyces TaxID=2593676 RepID=UPI00093E6CC7|nr:hypothetical protein [Streptomyces sp. TSRI0281]OKI45292.1 hypothetical protein A6A29_32160 [Streptomyces sp. TSRI0281]